MPDHKDILRQTNQALDKMLDEKRRVKNEEDRKYLVSNIGKDLFDILNPSIKEMAESLKLSRQELKEVLSQVKVEVPTIETPKVYVTIPEIKVPEAKVTIEIPEIKVPEIKLPVFKVPKPEVTVNIPEIKIPNIEVPETIESIPDNLSVSLKDVDRNNPLHVILTDSKGLPYSAQPIMTGSSGGGGGIMTGFDGSGNRKVLVDNDGRLITSASSGSTGSTNIIQLGGNDVAVNSGIVNSGTLRVVHATDVATSVSIVSVGSTLEVIQVSGSVDSVIVNSFLTSLDVKQVSGSSDSTNIIQLAGNTIATGNGDADSGTLRIVKVASSNSTTTAISVGADASTNIVPTNLGRRSIIITHASGSNLYVATGTASSTSSLPVVANQIVGFDDYTGPINAIAEEQAGTISVRYIEVS